MVAAVPALEARQVSKSYGETPVLVDVDFRLMNGEVLVIRGANGTGKSTLLRCLVGRERIDGGELWLDGVPLDGRLPSTGAAIAAGLGSGDRFLDLTVREHLEFVARAHGDPAPDPLIGSIMADLGLSAVQDRFPFAVSQGQRRRLELAACFVRPRRVLILDEPEQNLDAHGRELLAAKLLAERASGVAVVLSTHDPCLIDQVADSELELTFGDEGPQEQDPAVDIRP